MPSFRAPAAKTSELSWVMPDPSPEVESWKPDPDSVPVAGRLPDPRFNKDPLTESQRIGLKLQKRPGMSDDGLTASINARSRTASRTESPVPSALGSWPTPAPRATGVSRAFASIATDAQGSVFNLSEHARLVETIPVTSVTASTSNRVATATRRSIDRSKGTMETLSVQPPFRRPHTPGTSVASDVASSPTPAWAHSLEQCLGKSPPKPASTGRLQPAPVQEYTTKLPSVSTPPHLRKKVVPKCPQVGAPEDQKTGLDCLSNSATEPESIKAVQASKLPNRVFQKQGLQRDEFGSMQHSTIASYDERSKMVGDTKLQKTLLESFLPKKPVLSPMEHRRYLNQKLIGLMEDELDLQKRTTRHELQDMSNVALDSHLARTTYLHRLVWEDEQRVHVQREADLEDAVAAFQVQEQH